MKCVRLAAAAVAVMILALCGCRDSVDTTAGPGGQEPRQAQARLSTIRLWLGAEEMVAETALTPGQLRTGMMFRTNMAENEGMLFVLGATQQASFWMKNCPLPLSIAYIDPDGVIQEIHDLQPHNTNSVISTATNIRFALETRQGWFDRHSIQPGTVVRTEYGSLLETFVLQR